jgi:hypothetical protein
VFKVNLRSTFPENIFPIGPLSAWTAATTMWCQYSLQNTFIPIEKACRDVKSLPINAFKTNLMS